MKFEDVLSRFQGARKSGNGYSAKCPAHDDAKPSLCITCAPNGDTLLCCQGGCSNEAIVQTVGLQMGDLFANPLAPNSNGHSLRRIVETYVYADDLGEERFQKVRYDPKDFRIKHRDPADRSKWIWTKPPTGLLLYNLKRAKEAANSGALVIVAEGEKDCDALIKAGFVATCNPEGASKSTANSKWRPEYSASLKGGQIVVIADKDEAGRAHAKTVSESLRGLAASITVLELPDVNGKPVKDSFDYFAAGGTPESLSKLIVVAQEAASSAERQRNNPPKSKYLQEDGEDDQQEKPVRPYTIWNPDQFIDYEPPKGMDLLGNGLLRRGELCLLVGQGGIGKSRMSLWLACCQITGRSWCGFPTQGEPGKWLFIGNENSILRWKTDLTAMKRGFTAEEWQLIKDRLALLAMVEPDDGIMILSESFRRLEVTLDHQQPDALVLDPWSNFVPGNENDTANTRDALSWLCRIRSAYAPNSAVLIVAHGRTGRTQARQAVGGYDAGGFVRGSKVLFSVARTQFNLAPGDEDDGNQIVVACGKANNCEQFKTRGVVFNPDDFSYSVDPNFDLEEWKADVEGRRPEQKATPADVYAVICEGTRKAGEINKTVSDRLGVTIRTVERILKDGLTKGYWERLAHGAYILGPNVPPGAEPDSDIPTSDNPLGKMDVGMTASDRSRQVPTTSDTAEELAI